VNDLPDEIFAHDFWRARLQPMERFMRSFCLKFIAAVAMPVAGIIAAQAQTPQAGPGLAPLPQGQLPQAPQAQTSVGSKRPGSVPSNYVITPFGYFDPSCVVHLGQRDELQPSNGVIHHADGTNGQMPRCGFAHYRADGQAGYGDEKGAKDPNISHAWIVSLSTTTSSSFGFLSAEWSVPPTPASNNGQILFYFPGLEDFKDVVTIIQPVLGWNSDFASAWGIASWNCCVSGTVFEGPPQRVNPGDTILGYMFETCGGGVLSCGTWDIVTWDLQNGKFSELLNTSSFGQTFNWAFAGVLEVYNIVQCSDYPNNPNGFAGGAHDISFNEIGLYSDSFSQLTPAWTKTLWATGVTPQCNYNATVPPQALLND
jgi:hypothetical protein